MLFNGFHLVANMILDCFALFGDLMDMSGLWPLIFGMFLFALGIRFVLAPLLGGVGFSEQKKQRVKKTKSEEK